MWLAWRCVIPLFNLCLAITFFVAGLLINCCQAVLFVLVQPFSPNTFKHINYYLHYSLSSMILFVAEWWSGSDCRLHIRPDQLPFLGHEHALLIMNHSYEVDWLMGWIIADRFGVLGAAKVFVKDMLRFVPVIGWSWCFSNIVFLRRQWQHDQDHVNKQLNILGAYPHPVWMLIFCEGTRFTAAKHEASMAVAREKQLPELKHVLLPRTRGFVHSVSRLRHQFAAVYDLTIDFDTTSESAPPTLTSMVQGRRLVADMHVRRIAMSELPHDHTQLAAFLHRAYQRKDRMLDNYRASAPGEPRRWFSHQQHNNNTTSHDDDDGQATVVLPRRRVWSLLNSVMWACVVLTLTARLITASAAAAGSGWLVASFCTVLLVLLSVGFNKMISLTKISQGSQYGRQKSD